MKYKIGDKVRIRKDLIVGERYEGLTYYDGMKKEAERGSFTIDRAWIDSYGRRLYEFEECAFTYSEEMIETDRQKFEGWMRKLSSLPYDNKVWHAFNYIVTGEPDKDGYDDRLKIVSDFLFTEKKKMTKAEIEKALGYKIEIVERRIIMAKYKAGDKVVIRKDLEVGVPYGTKTFVSLMKEMCDAHDYVLTIKTVCEDDVYYMEEDERWLPFVWTDQMIEKLYVDTDTKFEAFLREVVDGTSEENYKAWDKIRVLSRGIDDDSKKEATTQWLVDFYNNFVPKDEIVKKMTKAEIEAELGYKIEIVEE